MKYSINAKTDVFKGHAFDVQKLSVTLPDGRVRNYDLVNHRNSATIIPVEDNGDIWFVEQYRMGSENILLELPAGVIDCDETPEACATREVREEIGFAAGKMTLLGSIYLAPGYSNEINYIFLAKNLTHNPLQQDEDEFLSVKKIAEKDINELISSGKLQDSKSLAALLIYQQKQNET